MALGTLINIRVLRDHLCIQPQHTMFHFSSAPRSYHAPRYPEMDDNVNNHRQLDFKHRPCQCVPKASVKVRPSGGIDCHEKLSSDKILWHKMMMAERECH